MCGRFTLHRPARAVAEAFELPSLFDLPPRYNIGPTQNVLAIRNEHGFRQPVLLRWGLIPPWSVGGAGNPPLINARAETVANKPTFREPFQRRRCVVPADGFFEWKAEGGKKVPHYFTPVEGGLFAFAGLWECRADDPGSVETVAFLTIEANALVGTVHDRMPVILPADSIAAWLDPGETNSGRLRRFLKPVPAEAMTVRRVSGAVGNVRNDSPACIEPAPEGTAAVQRMLF